MTPEALDDLLNPEHFRPFRIRLSNGQTYEIPALNRALVGEGRLYVRVEGYRVHQVALLHINSAEPLN